MKFPECDFVMVRFGIGVPGVIVNGTPTLTVPAPNGLPETEIVTVPAVVIREEGTAASNSGSPTGCVGRATPFQSTTSVF